MELGTVNGVRVLSAARVPFKHDDDAHVRARCEGRALVLFDGGGKSDAVVISGRAVIWERQGERFRAFPLAPRPIADELFALLLYVRGLAQDTQDREVSSMLLSVAGMLNATRLLKELPK